MVFCAAKLSAHCAANTRNDLTGISVCLFSFSFLNSMSPRSGALTTWVQESLPSGTAIVRFLSFCTVYSKHWYYAHCFCDSEGAAGLNVFYWSKFSAPEDVAMAIRRSSPGRLQRRLPGINKLVQHSRNEQRYFMEQDPDMLHLLGIILCQSTIWAILSLWEQHWTYTRSYSDLNV